VTTYLAQTALVDGAPVRDLLLVADGGRFVDVRTAQPGDGDRGDVVRLGGVTLAGFANAHSHAFHRALRGRTHDRGGSFWTWRDDMYSLAAGLTPDLLYRLARATYAEMVLAGVTCVGEFHYVHHQPDGTPYDAPTTMSQAIAHAARDAGLRLTLLDVCYLAGGLDADGYRPVSSLQQRFSDGDAARWRERFETLAPSTGMLVGAAIHSVRATPPDAMSVVVEAAAGKPLHMHLSEQPAENRACQARFGRTPTELLADHGALGPRSTAVHATHLTAHDVALLGASRTTACVCPTTERDLADGIGPASALHDAGSPLAVGSDQHAVIDLVEEVRALEMHERLSSGERGRLSPVDLLAALTVHGHASLGWQDAGRLAVGMRADLVCLRTDTVRTAGCSPEQILLAATAADVDTVVVEDRVVVRGGRHESLDVATELQSSITDAWSAARAQIAR
jgi:formiminoglutamate deiminase